METVLVPIDGSSHAEAALVEAFELFPEAEVHAFHVIQVKDLPRGEDDSAFDLAAEEADEILDGAAAMAEERGREIVTDAIEGPAAKTIVSYAEDNDVDYIVMGSTGRTGLSRLLLGSVAESVIRRSPCSVMVVRED